MKLQQAYFAEQNLIGGWTMIGYTAPGSGQTTNFNYGEGVSDHGTTTTSANIIGWAADNRVQLNDCPAGSKVTSSNMVGVASGANWSITVVAATSGTSATGDVSFTATVADHNKCMPLTPSFESIGR